MKLTKAARKALEILRKSPRGMTGGEFSQIMWAESWANSHTTSRRHGLRRRGGSYLSYLARKGLVGSAPYVCTYNAGYKISDAGLKALEALEAMS